MYLSALLFITTDHIPLEKLHQSRLSRVCTSKRFLKYTTHYKLQFFLEKPGFNVAEYLDQLPAPDPPIYEHEWHENVNNELRGHLVGKIVRTLYPGNFCSAANEQGFKDIVEYARKVEKEMFEMANDREEYYHLIAEKIYEIQKALHEKRNKRISSDNVEKMESDCVK